MKKLLALLCSACVLPFAFGLTACKENKYGLVVDGSVLLYENLNDEYKAGEQVTVKVKIKPYEGVKVTLDNQQLVKVKSTQNGYWQFGFTMPARRAFLAIKAFKDFDEPLLYGFHLTFCGKDGEPIEALSKPFDSKQAVADYAVISYKDNKKIYYSNEGADVFCERKTSLSNISYGLEDTLYYTYELIDAVAVVDRVYLDEATGEYRTVGNAGYCLNGTASAISTFFDQHLTDSRFNAQLEEYEAKFDSSVKINFKKLDYLTGVKVLEYGADNALLRSADILRSDSGIKHTVGADCEYAVVEEEYTVKSGENIGEKHTERTLIEKNLKHGGIATLKYPRGDGLITPVMLEILW